MDSIEGRIKSVMATVFDVNPDIIDETASQDTIEGWDSVNHLNLVISIEEEFGIEIPIEEVGNMLNFQLVTMLVKEQLG